MKKSLALAGIAFLAVGCTVEDHRTPPPTYAQPQPQPTAQPNYAVTNPGTPPPTNHTNTVTGTGTVATPIGTATGSVSVSWTNWSAPGTAVQPNGQCVKESNKELCWDGVDNNCDGHIDEGCPYGGGEAPLHFMISWRANVDLDLHVMGPDGQEVNFKQRVGGTLMLDQDCHGDDCVHGNVENVYLAPGHAVLKGHYKIWINDGNPKADKAATVPVMFGLGVGVKAWVVPGFVNNSAGFKQYYEFDVI